MPDAKRYLREKNQQHRNVFIGQHVQRHPKEPTSTVENQTLSIAKQTWFISIIQVAPPNCQIFNLLRISSEQNL